MSLFQLGTKLFTIAVLIFFVIPLALVISVSFTQGQFLSFPPEGFSFRWYYEVFSNSAWINSMQTSFLVAIATSIFSTLLAGSLAFAMDRYDMKIVGYIRSLGFLPILLPPITFGVALMTFFYSIGYQGHITNIILAHSIFFLPFPLILISTGLEEIDKSLEEAALTLGASEVKTFRTITLPLIRSNIFAAMLFAFVLSLNEYIVAFLCSGLSIVTMPIKIFNSLRYALAPDIAAVSTLFILVTVILVSLVNKMVGGIWRSL